MHRDGILKCPIHGCQMWYAPHVNTYSCQVAECAARVARTEAEVRELADVVEEKRREAAEEFLYGIDGHSWSKTTRENVAENLFEIMNAVGKES